MEIRILLPHEQSKQGAIHLKNMIDRASIEGVAGTEIERAAHDNGQMGAGDLLNSVKTIIEAASEPLVALVTCLQKYVDNYRTVITIPTKNGNIELKHGRSMKAEELKELVTAIQQSNA
jgi:hypothetical protein